LGSGFRGVDPRLIVHLSYPGLTGLTCACDRSDQCKVLEGFASGELLGSCGFGLWCCWSILGRFQGGLLGFVKVSLLLQFEF
jgi:hypothetical protein